MLVGSQLRRVAIVGGIRIPFARAMGAYAECSNQDMLVARFARWWIVTRSRANGWAMSPREPC